MFSVFACLHLVAVVNVSDVSELYTSSNFWVEVNNMGKILCVYVFCGYFVWTRAVLLSDPREEGSMYVRNVGKIALIYTVWPPEDWIKFNNH
jgi:hypothetical protein